MPLPEQFEVVTWEYVYKLLLELARRIKNSKFNPDIIVGLSRGGLIPARVLSDLLDNPQLASIRVELYINVYQTMQEPVITQPVSASVTNKRVLLVDDVTDSGKSLKLVWEDLWRQAMEVKTVTLFHKPWSCYKPDFFMKITEAWIIFPWEYYESVKSISTKMLREAKGLPEIEEN